MNRWRRDLAVAALVGGVLGAGVIVAVATLDQRFLDPATGNDVWFEGDLGRIADEMTHRWSAHSRATVHPLFALLTVPPAYLLRASGLPAAGAVAVVAGIAASVWTAACYALMRAVGAFPADAVLLTLLTASTAAGQFWLTVPETAALGSASVLGTVALAAAAERHRLSDGWLVLASAGSLSITVTNWIAGIIATFAAVRRARAIEITGMALALVVVLWAVQRVVTPYADFFVGYSNEQRYLLRPEAGGPLNALRVLTVNAVVAPPHERVVKPNRGTVMSMQHRGLRDTALVGRVAAVLWLGLLAYGLSITVRGWHSSGVRVLMLVLGCQLALYAVYGTETFLYGLNVVPLLVAQIAGAVSGPARSVVRMGVAALLILLSVSNAARLLDARSYFTPAVAARMASMSAPTSLPSSPAPR
jgi:hypothetical protein